MERRTFERLGWIVLAVPALCAPFVADGYHLYQLTQVLITAIALVGLNLLTGYNGQISLGHGAFFAVGGTLTAVLVVKFGWPYGLAIPVAGAVCFAAGFAFGFPALRLGGLYLSLATFALAVAAPQIISYKGFDALTGGSQGLQVPKPHAPFGLQLSVDQWLYVLTLAVAAAGFFVAANLTRGRLGRAITALRDHTLAAETMGVDAALTKTFCFGISALYAGVSGGLSAIVVGFVSPESFNLLLSLSFLVGIVIGGLGSIAGAIFGAAFLQFLPNWADGLTSMFGENAKALPSAVYGVMMIVAMAAMPRGVVGALRATAMRLGGR